jgi:hypothetical protein
MEAVARPFLGKTPVKREQSIDLYTLPNMELPEALDTSNRPDEWKIEQGMAGHKLPILDQTGTDTIHIYPTKPQKLIKDEEAIVSVGDRDKLFARELEGWKGYACPAAAGGITNSSS